MFHKGSLASFSHAPVTMDRHAEPVTAETWRPVAIGEARDEVPRDGERRRIPLIVKGAVVILAGKHEIRAGSTCTLDGNPGTAPDATPYVAALPSIKTNNIAIVARGCAGLECASIMRTHGRHSPSP